MSHPIRRVVESFVAWLILAPFLQAHSGGVPPEFVDALTDEYLAIHQALSEDDLQAAKLHGKALSKAFNTGSSEKAHSSFSALRRRAHRIGRSLNLTSARTEFSKLSASMKSVLQDLERDNFFPLHAFSCQDAIPGEIAFWIQKDPGAQSPYGCSQSNCNPKLEQPITDLH